MAMQMKRIEIGHKNHNIQTYLKMAEEDFENGKNRSNDKYENENYGVAKN